uniref:Uncharacterized protein n=1 Tax=Romanomermis culicivorax TaxID=13658 RepID=A0A915JQB6_ROMCU
MQNSFFCAFHVKDRRAYPDLDVTQKRRSIDKSRRFTEGNATLTKTDKNAKSVTDKIKLHHCFILKREQNI